MDFLDTYLLFCSTQGVRDLSSLEEIATSEIESRTNDTIYEIVTSLARYSLLPLYEEYLATVRQEGYRSALEFLVEREVPLTYLREIQSFGPLCYPHMQDAEIFIMFVAYSSAVSDLFGRETSVGYFEDTDTLVFDATVFGEP